MLSLASLALAAGAATGVRALGASYPPIPEDRTTPVQQRLALQGPSTMAVSWNTYQYMQQPCVSYGTSASSLSLKACSDISVTYPTSRTWSNTVTLQNLRPATKYYYKIESTNSSVLDFQTGRTPGDQTPFTAALVIDLGVYGADGYTISNSAQKRDIPTLDPSLTHTTIASLYDRLDEYELVLHPGDLAYADDWYLKPKNLLDGVNAYEAILEQFYQQLAPVSARKAYQVSPGNHESACDELPGAALACPEGQKNFTDFHIRFGNSMPFATDSTSTNKTAVALRQKAKSLAKPPFYWSFDYGMVHVLMYDTETDFPKAPDGDDGSAGLFSGPFGYPGEQLDFIEADLASVDRDVTPWVIAGGHRPYYSTGGSDNVCEPCQDAFEDVFARYGVDAVFNGHVHNSQRFDPVYKGTADPAGLKNPKAPWYIVAGGAGNIEGGSDIQPQPSYTKFAYNESFSYAQFTFEDKNNLKITFLKSSDSSVLDTATLYKAHAEQFVDQQL